MATITKNLYDTVHLRDNYGDTIVGGGGISRTITDEVHLRDDFGYSVDAAGQLFRLIEDEVHLRDDDISTVLIGAGGLSVNLSETVHLRDDFADSVLTTSIMRYIFDEVQLRDEFTYEVVQNIKKIYNENVSFGETKDIGYKEFSHRFRWTDYNGIAVPDLNYKDLKEPITRLIPAPSFLQFEYGNSFILFTRNTINRFVLDADVDTGQWRAKTDNLIEEFKDVGLMEPKTLVLAGATLFGLSEKGVWKWNKDGLDLISDKKIEIPDAGDHNYIGFYNPIRNQYLLHRQESSGGIYQMTKGSQYAFAGGDSAQYARSVMLDETTFVSMAYESIGAGFPDALKIRVGSIGTGGVITYGSTVEVESSAREYLDIKKLSSTKVLLTYYRQTGGGAIRTADISGTTITLNTVYDVPGGDQYVKELAMMSDNSFVLFNGYQTYITGSVTGDVVSLNTLQTGFWGYNVSPGSIKTAGISTGYGVIAIALTQGGSFGKVIGFQDNGDGTITLGTPYITTEPYNYFKGIDLEILTSTLFIVSYSEYDGGNNNVVVEPLTFDSATLDLTAGSAGKLVGAGYNVGGFGRTSIARANASGFWLFYEDHLNSEYLTVIYGAASGTAISYYTLTKEEVQAAASHTINAIHQNTGSCLLVACTDETQSSNGYAQIWGVDYAAIDTYVYQIDRNRWNKFLGLDILDVPVILSGGSLDENYNIWLDSYRELQKYPGSAYTSADAWIRTKEFYIEEGVFQRWLVDFEGAADVETRVKREVSGSTVEKEDIKYNVSPNKWRWISLEKQRGRTMSIKIINPDIIKALSFDIKRWGEK